MEALLGAVHIDGGRIAGQKAVLYIMKSLLDAVSAQLNFEETEKVEAKVKDFMHPKQVIHELAGRHLQLRSWREASFAIQFPSCPVWRGMQWGLPTSQSNDFIGQIVCCGMNVIALSDASSHTAKNRVCAFAVNFFKRKPLLLEKIRKIALSLVKDGKTRAEIDDFEDDDD